MPNHCLRGTGSTHWTKLRHFALAVLLIGLALVLPLSAQDGQELLLYEEDFDDEQAQGWKLAETNAGRWVADGGLLYGEGAAAAIYGPGQWEDHRLTLDAYFLNTADGLLISVRYSEAGRYVLGLFPQRAELGKQVGRNIEPVAKTVRREFEPKIKHSVSISAYGNHLLVIINGQQLFDWRDQNPLPAGTIRLDSLNKSLVSVDNIRVYGPSRVSRVEQPDLVVGGLRSWRYDDACRMLWLTIEIANAGSADSPAVPLLILDPELEWQMARVQVPVLAPEGQEILNVPVKMPPDQQQRGHTLWIEIDPEGTVTELNEDNNLAKGWVPACAVTEEATEPPTPLIERIVPPTVRCDNEVILQLQGENLPETARVELGPGIEIEFVERLNAKALKVGAFVMPDAKPGRREVRVWDTQGNLIPSRFALQVDCARQPSLPDLVLGRLDTQINEPSQTLIIEALVANRGPAPSNPTRLSVRSGDWEDNVLVPAMDSGDTVSTVLRLAIPPDLQGKSRRLFIELDPENELQELDDTNNSDTLDVDLPTFGTGPDLPWEIIALVGGSLLVGGGLIWLIRRVWHSGGGQEAKGGQEGSPAVPGVGPIRLGQIWLTEGASGEGPRLDDDQPLLANQNYTLHFQIRSLKAAETGESTASAAGMVPLRVAFFAPTEDFNLDRQSVTVPLAGEGASIKVQRPLTPQGTGEKQLRVGVYYQNVLLQSMVLEAQVIDANHRRTEGQAIRRQTDYVARSDIGAVEGLPQPALNLFTNQATDGSHWIGVYAMDQVQRAEPAHHLLRTFDADQLATNASRLRHTLLDIEADSKGYYRVGVGSADQMNRYIERLEGDLLALAVDGFTAYDNLFFSGSGEQAHWQQVFAMQGVLADPAIISVARCRAERGSLPWAALYAYDLAPGKIEAGQGELCPVFKQQLAANVWTPDMSKLIETQDYLDSPAQCRAQDECPIKGAKKDVTVCPFGFWGFMHQIEQPLQQVQPTSTDQVPPELALPGFDQTSHVLRQAGETTRLGLAVYVDIPQMEAHRLEFEQLTQNGQVLLEYASAYDEIVNMLEQGNLHLYYFYCHGDVKDQLFRLRLASEQHPAYVSAADLKPQWFRTWSAPPQPVVMINACESIATVPEVVHDFLGKLRGLGACGIVGTEIKVWTDLAQPFGSQLVNAFLRGESVGEAFLNIRRQLLRRCNPLGLAYTFYAPATLHLHAPNDCLWCQSHQTDDQ